MGLGKAETCGHCGKQFKARWDKHDEQDCIDHLTRERDEEREATVVLTQERNRLERERDEARDQVAALKTDNYRINKHRDELEAELDEAEAKLARVVELCNTGHIEMESASLILAAAKGE